MSAEVSVTLLVFAPWRLRYRRQALQSPKSARTRAHFRLGCPPVDSPDGGGAPSVIGKQRQEAVLYLRKLTLQSIRSIDYLELAFEKSAEAGWHVVLGQNGSGKSSVIRSLALLVMGEREAYAARQDFSRWISIDEDTAAIKGDFSVDADFDTLAGGGRAPKRVISCEVGLERTEGSFATAAIATFTGERVHRTLWGGAPGWFCASFGPFRRFTGGDRVYDRLFVSNKRLAPHLTALGEDVALSEALSWLSTLHVQALQDERSLGPDRAPYSYVAQSTLDHVVDFLNSSSFMPNGATIEMITNDHVLVRDGNHNIIPVEQLSDGYRSALSMALELIRQMFELYGWEKMVTAMSRVPGTIQAPGVVAIDEVDAHLHPTWQRDIGRWLTRAFPLVQFIVTTHSPIVCRAVARPTGELKGSVWKLPTPGTNQKFRKVIGSELEQLVFGDVLDAFATELFGQNVMRSEEGTAKLERLAFLNLKALNEGLSQTEAAERRSLRQAFPSAGGITREKNI